MARFKEGAVVNQANWESIDLRRRPVIVGGQENGWDEPYKSRALRTVLWAAGGEIPSADSANRWSSTHKFLMVTEAAPLSAVKLAA